MRPVVHGRKVLPEVKNYSTIIGNRNPTGRISYIFNFKTDERLDEKERA